MGIVDEGEWALGWGREACGEYKKEGSERLSEQ